MARRRTLVWIFIGLLALPVVMATADMGQRAAEGDLIFRLGHFHEGERFVYDVSLWSEHHEMGETVPGQIVIEVGARGPRTLADGSSVDVFPLTFTEAPASWYAFRSVPDDSERETRGQASTYYYRTTDGVMAGFRDERRTSLFIEEDGATVRQDLDLERERVGSFAGPVDEEFLSGSLRNTGPEIYGFVLDAVGPDVKQARGTGTLGNTRVYDLAYGYERTSVGPETHVSCIHAHPSISYVDFQITPALEGRTIRSHVWQEAWMAADEVLPRLASCHVEFVDADTGERVERASHIMRLVAHEPGGARVPVALGSRGQHDPAGAMDTVAVPRPGALADGSGAPLLFPLSEALAAVEAWQDSDYRAFRNGAAPRFALADARYANLPQADNTPADPGPGLPPLPLPPATPPSEGLPVVTHNPTWQLTLLNGRGEILPVQVHRELRDDGSYEDTVTADTSSVAFAAPPDPKLLPAQAPTVAALLTHWLAQEGLTQTEWEADPTSSLFLNWRIDADNREQAGRTGRIDITGAQPDLAAEAEPWGNTTTTTYRLPDGTPVERVEQSRDTERGAAPRPASAEPATRIAVGPGHVPKAATAGAFAVVAAVAMALFWDGVRGVLINSVFLPLYAKIAKDRLLDHTTREEIVGFVDVNPGASMREIRAATGIGFGTAIHHLATLERNQLLLSTRMGRRRCYFTPGQLNIRERQTVGTLRSPAARRVLEAIMAHPGITQVELAETLGITPKAVRFQVERLREADALRVERDGRAVRYHAVEPDG